MNKMLIKISIINNYYENKITIVGGGPAGLMAAYILSKNGFRVLFLIENQQ